MSRSKFECSKKSSLFDSILYKCRQFIKQKKQTLLMNRIMCITEVLPKNVLMIDDCKLLMIASSKFKVLIILKAITNHNVIEVC